MSAQNSSVASVINRGGHDLLTSTLEKYYKKDGLISYTPRMNDSNEKTPGGWNTYEIICNVDTIELKVNGQFQNKATGVSIRKGYIGFQSEGVPIIFRNFKLTPLR